MRWLGLCSINHLLIQLRERVEHIHDIFLDDCLGVSLFCFQLLCTFFLLICGFHLFLISVLHELCVGTESVIIHEGFSEDLACRLLVLECLRVVWNAQELVLSPLEHIV